MRTPWAFRRAAVLVTLAPAAWACGVCVEDRVAATYDHAVVQRAAAKGNVMVYCAVSGELDATRIRSAARRVRGLDLASIRFSSEPAAVSFALDGARQSPQAAVSMLQQAMPAGIAVAIVKVVAPAGTAIKPPG